jgi:N4-gp56 family major capsid protein
MDFKTLVMNAIDSNGFQSTATAAGYINPELWNREVLKHVEDTLVVARYAKVYNDILGAPGDAFNVTIGAEPAAASSVQESADVTISAYSVTTVQFVPTEYALGYQLHDKEARRAFYDVAGDMAANIGYALAKNRDTLALSTVTTGAGNAVVANSVVASAIASSDTLDWDDIVNAKVEIMKDKLIPKVLIVSPGQLGQLMKTAAFRDASQFGGRETILGGELKVLGGLTVVWSTLITPTASRSKAILLGYDMRAQSPFGVGFKSLPSIRTERHELGRYTDVVGVEEFQFKVLRANGICTIESYDTA